MDFTKFLRTTFITKHLCDGCFWNLYVLNYSLNVTFTLIALMTYIIFIIQQASFEIVDSQALLTSIRWLRKWCFGFCLIVESGNTKVNGTDVMGCQNDSSRFTSAPNISPNACLTFFVTETAFRFFFVSFNPMSKWNFWLGQISQLFLLKDFHLQTTNTSHLQFCLL